MIPVFPVGTAFAFQGKPGACSDLACHGVFPAPRTLRCPSFEDIFAAVREGSAMVKLLGVYPAHPFRRNAGLIGED